MEIDKEEIKYRAALYKKKSKLREEVLKCDWKKDGYMLLGGKRVEYITSEKIVRNFAPLLSKVGLEIECGFEEPQRLDPFGDRREEHWLSTFVVRYVDVDTGFMTLPNCYHGEGMDQRDKALKKANTDAQKLWLLADFKIGEGIDPDAGTNDTTGAYIPKDEQEQVEIKTKIATAAVKPKAPAPKPKVEVPVKVEVENVEEIKEQIQKAAEETKAAEPAPAAPKKAPAAPKKAPEAPKTETAEDIGVAAAKIEPGCNTEYGKTITKAQKAPLVGIYSQWITASKNKTVSDEKFDEVTEAYMNIGSNKDIVGFIAKYRGVKE